MHDNSEKYANVLEIFRQDKVMSLKQLADLLGCSERTVQRYLNKWRTHTSYNKNGRYYILPDIPRFDENVCIPVNSATQSNANRPPNPEYFGHPLQAVEQGSAKTMRFPTNLSIAEHYFSL